MQLLRILLNLPLDTLKSHLQTTQSVAAQQTFWDTPFGKIVPGIIGSIIGIFSSFILLAYTRKLDKKKSVTQKNELELNKLKSLSINVDSIIQTVETNIHSLKKTISKINKDNVSFHPVTVTSLNCLRRIADLPSLDDYMLAYANYFKDKDSVQTFNDIIDDIDYLYYELSSITSLVNNGGKIITDLEQSIMAKNEEVREYFKDIFLNPHVITTPQFIKLNELYQALINNRPLSIKFLAESYFIPLNEYLAKEVIPFTTYKTIHDIGGITLKGIELYYELIAENNQFKVMLEDILGKISESVKDLKTNSTQLREIKP